MVCRSYTSYIRYGRSYYSGIYLYYYNMYYYHTIPGSRVQGTTYNAGKTLATGYQLFVFNFYRKLVMKHVSK